MIRVHVKIVGRVQGVAFRYSTKAQADKLGVLGWVRNDASSDVVEATFEGTREAVDALLEWCWSGPALAKVRDVQVRKLISANEPFKAFEIR